jgi:ubiquinone/menaquinone biosynthesis C-methylase UbiE/predicted transcriptional regulator
MLEVLKILADTTRLRLLRILRQGDFTVQDLMQALNMGQSRISRHLILMSEAGLLKVEKQGTWRYYRLAPESAFFQKIWPAIEEHLDELDMQEQDANSIYAIMAERRKRSQEFFDRHARDWDVMHNELLNLPDYQSELLALLPEGGLTVEIGVGSGTLLHLLIEKADRVIGLDQSPSMVNLARETVQQCQLTEFVDVRLAEMKHLPLADDSVRTLVMNQVLHHAEQPGDVLKEVGRVLDASGILVIADLTRHEHDWARERLADQWLGFRQEELEIWLAEAGMQICTYQEFGGSKSFQGVLLLTAKLNNNN